VRLPFFGDNKLRVAYNIDNLQNVQPK